MLGSFSSDLTATAFVDSLAERQAIRSYGSPGNHVNIVIDNFNTPEDEESAGGFHELELLFDNALSFDVPGKSLPLSQ